eukprot:TRINITY_DN903_c0_g2_i1.p1 TRINITY_DN903_c0_g2~~TRINITY_DN903_c0_g2_i1.p1  ORF type:complete len:402 (-),score=123.68 TRINITY_DN903_c0_g2_i1:66-1271(-)
MDLPKPSILFRLLAFAASVAAVSLATVPLENAVEFAALQSDDQCVSGSDCSLNALQAKVKSGASQVKSTIVATHGDEADEANDQVLKEDLFNLQQIKDVEDADEDVDEEWAKDITTKAKNRLKAALIKLQKPILGRYANLTELEAKVNASIKKVENATGEPVLWNEKALLEVDGAIEDNQEEDAVLTSLSGRRRRRRRHLKKLPPRARYVMKIVKYLDKEMHSVWDLYTIVDRKRYGILNTVISHPDGPSGRKVEVADAPTETQHSYGRRRRRHAAKKMLKKHKAPEDEDEDEDKEVEEPEASEEAKAKLALLQDIDAEESGRRRRRRHHEEEDEEEKIKEGDYVIKPQKRRRSIRNKYEKELQDDYDDIVRQINDCYNKTEVLRATLAKTIVKATIWMNQ